MENRKSQSSTFQIKFLLNHPTHYKDFGYELHRDQVITGSILLKHYPLGEKEKEIFQSAHTLCKISKKIGATI